MDDELTEGELTILRGFLTTDHWRVVKRVIDLELKEAEQKVDNAMIGCEVFQHDLRFALGYRDGVRALYKKLESYRRNNG